MQIVTAMDSEYDEFSPAHKKRPRVPATTDTYMAEMNYSQPDEKASELNANSDDESPLKNEPDEPVTKRLDVLAWDHYFMSIAFLSAQRSKDPSTRVGACIVNQYNTIVGVGYNGFPVGCSDDALPWARNAKCENDTKYPYVVHVRRYKTLYNANIDQRYRLKLMRF